jgi:hypothetical protein
MSDLNDLIHTNATIAFNQGAQREQERIVKIIQNYGSEDFTAELIELIKGEQK